MHQHIQEARLTFSSDINFSYVFFCFNIINYFGFFNVKCSESKMDCFQVSGSLLDMKGHVSCRCLQKANNNLGRHILLVFFGVSCATISFKSLLIHPTYRILPPSVVVASVGSGGPTLIRSCQMICHPHPLEKSFSHVAGTEIESL